LRYAPFSVPFEKAALRNWGDLRIDGYMKDKKVISKSYSGRGADRRFVALADDGELRGDGRGHNTDRSFA